VSEADRRSAAAGLAAARGTVAGLHVALKARLEAIAKGFPLFQTKTDDRRAPTVVDFTLPPKEEAAAEQFPFIALRARVGSDSEQSSDQNARATFDIEIGTYGDDDDGYLDLLLLIDAIRLDLGAKPTIDGTAYEHVGPLTWETPFPQPRPHWLGVATTIWSLPRPRRVEAQED
jgi:hypothetical protein